MRRKIFVEMAKEKTGLFGKACLFTTIIKANFREENRKIERSSFAHKFSTEEKLVFFHCHFIICISKYIQDGMNLGNKEKPHSDRVIKQTKKNGKHNPGGKDGKQI